MTFHPIIHYLTKIIQGDASYNNSSITNVIPQVGLGQVQCVKTEDLTPTLVGREAVSDRPLAQGKTYQNRYYRKHDKVKHDCVTKKVLGATRLICIP